MRPAAPACLICLLATASVAEDLRWQPQYLSYDVEGLEDHPLPIVVAKGAHQFAEAYYRDANGRGIYVGCDDRYAGAVPELAFGQAGDHDFLGPAAPLTISFDAGPPLALDDVGYQPGRYWVPLSYPVLDGLLSAEDVWVRTANGETVIRAPLAGAAEAIAVLDCLAAAGV